MSMLNHYTILPHSTPSAADITNMITKMTVIMNITLITTM